MLHKSLPPGILVRVFDDRIDILRVLMVGPDNSPYAGGLFMFDLRLPDDYPNSPPGKVPWL
jgi:ubiquitin-protein ligase